MRGKSLAWRLIGLFFGLMMMLNFVRDAGAGNLIRLLSPKAGTVLKGEVTLQAVVESPEVSYVVFGVDDSRPHATNSAPYRYVLDTEELSNGSHQLFVEAYSRSGLLGRSAPVRVAVKNFSEMRPLKSAPQEKPEVVVIAPRLEEKPTVASFADGVKPDAIKENLPAASAPLLSVEPRLSSEIIASPEAATAIKKGTAYVALPAQGETKVLQGGPVFLLNGKALAWDKTMVLIDGKLQAGFRTIMEAAGWKVEWLADRKAGVATINGVSMEVVLGKDKVSYDGVIKALGEPARLSQDRLVVPVRPLCDASGMTVAWDGGTHTICLISPYLALAKMNLDGPNGEIAEAAN